MTYSLHLPIYLVVYEYDRSTALSNQYGIGIIVAIFECDFADYEQIWKEQIAPLQDVGMGRTVMTHIYRRFPEGLFPKETLIPKEGQPKQEPLMVEDSTGKLIPAKHESGELIYKEEVKRDESYDDLF